MHSASSPVFIAALDVATVSQADKDLHALIDGVHRQGTYVVVAPAGFRVASRRNPALKAEAGGPRTAGNHRAPRSAEPLAELTDFIQLVDNAAATGD